MLNTKSVLTGANTDSSVVLSSSVHTGYTTQMSSYYRAPLPITTTLQTTTLGQYISSMGVQVPPTTRKVATQTSHSETIIIFSSSISPSDGDTNSVLEVSTSKLLTTKFSHTTFTTVSETSHRPLVTPVHLPPVSSTSVLSHSTTDTTLTATTLATSYDKNTEVPSVHASSNSNSQINSQTHNNLNLQSVAASATVLRGAGSHDSHMTSSSTSQTATGTVFAPTSVLSPIQPSPVVDRDVDSNTGSDQTAVPRPSVESASPGNTHEREVSGLHE